MQTRSWVDLAQRENGCERYYGDHLVFSSEVVDFFLCWDLQGDYNSELETR